ncbi:hypothetical protein ACLJJ6_00435 [Pediococcus siamensis]|uniref:hypothetical protein n=1 Tax=Pediococcus siamensis TaxID=381829 RepID=UPI0039A11F4A
MTTQLSQGKFTNLQELADTEGTFNFLGLAQNKAAVQLTAKQQIEFTQLVADALAATTTGTILTATDNKQLHQVHQKQAGLITLYDPHAKAQSQAPSLGRFVHTTHSNAVLLPLTYNPHADNDQKLAFVERVGAEALAADLPLIISLTTTDETATDKTQSEFAKKQPQLVLDTLKELTKPRYHIDILQIETPLNFDFVEGFTSQDVVPVYSRREAAKLLKEASDITTIPFIYRSGLNTMTSFQAAVKFAGQAGAKFAGITLDESLWETAVTEYLASGESGLNHELQHLQADVQTLNATLENYATPWYDRFGGLKQLDLFTNPFQL